MNTINDQIRRHPFFAGFPEELFQELRLCANPVTYADGETIYRQGDHAEAFFLVQAGRIALELQAGHQGTVIIQTISAGQMLGWSWLFAPFRRQFDARAVTAVTALALQAECLQHQCDRNHHLGHELYRRFSNAVVASLQAARLQLLDLYGREPFSAHRGARRR